MHFTLAPVTLGAFTKSRGALCWGLGAGLGDGGGAEHRLEELDRTMGTVQVHEQRSRDSWEAMDTIFEQIGAGQGSSKSPEALQTQRESGDPAGKPPAVLASTSSGRSCKYQEGCASVSRNMCHLPNFIMQPTKTDPCYGLGMSLCHPSLCCAWISLYSFLCGCCRSPSL